MQFYDAIITNEGVRMLTAASFSNKLTFTRLLFSADNVTLGVTTQSLEHSWGNGHIDNYASAADGSFVIYGSASNAQDYGMAYGFAVYGYLNSEGPENEHIIFVANADGVPTYVNSQSGAATRFQFAIKAKIHLSDQVIRIDPNYNGLVSNMAFQDLLERTVTTHSATDAQVGDDQTVRGHKEFVNGIGVWDSNNGWGIEITNYENNEGKAAVLLRTTNGAYYGSAIELIPKTSQNQSYTKNDIKLNANLIPADDGLSLGVNGHRWFEMNAYSLWASERVGVSNPEHGATHIGPGSIEFLNMDDDSIGTIGIQNDTMLNIDGNGSPVHITALTVDNGMSVVGSTQLQGTTYVRSLLWANDNIRCDGSITINSVTLTGAGNVLSVNKSTTVSGDVTCARVLMSSNVMGINGAGGEPYYIGVNNGVLQIGMNNSGTNISGGGLKVSALTTETLNVDSFTRFKMTEGISLGYENYPTIGQVTSTTANIALGAIIFAYVSSDTPIYAGQELPDGTTIQFMDFLFDNLMNLGATMNVFYIKVSPQSHRYAPLSPVTRLVDGKYRNLTLVMRIR